MDSAASNPGAVPAAVKHPQLSLQSVRSHQSSVQPAKAKPWVTLIVGQDSISTGLTATLWLPSRGRWEHTETLMSQRWLMPPMNVNELVSLAIRGLEAWEVRMGTRPARTDGTSV